MSFLHVWFCLVLVRETELWLTCSVRAEQKTLLRSVTRPTTAYASRLLISKKFSLLSELGHASTSTTQRWVFPSKTTRRKKPCGREGKRPRPYTADLVKVCVPFSYFCIHRPPVGMYVYKLELPFFHHEPRQENLKFISNWKMTRKHTWLSDDSDDF